MHAGVDWDWEMPALFAWFFGAAGLVCAARADRVRLGAPGRLTRVVAGLGCLLLTIGPASVAVSQRALDDGTRAFKAGDCAGAADARAGQPRRPRRCGRSRSSCSATATCARGREDLAVRAFASARARDPQDWQYAYGLAVAQALDGHGPAADGARGAPPQPARRRGRGSWPPRCARRPQALGPGRRACADSVPVSGGQSFAGWTAA